MTHAADRKAKSARDKKAGARAQRAPAKSSAPERPAEAQRLGGSYAMGPAVGLRSSVQAKLTVGRPGDRFEREADSVADRVTTGQPAGDVSRIPPGGLKAQRAAENNPGGEAAADEGAKDVQPKCAACEAKQAQRRADPNDHEDAGTAQAKCAACEAKDAQRAEDESSDEAQERVQRAEDESTDEAQERAQRAEDESTDEAQERAQRAEDESTDEAQERAQRAEDESTDEAQERAQRAEDESTNEAQERAQRAEDESTDEAQERAQRAEDESTDEAQERAQREEDEGSDVQEIAQRAEEQGDESVQELAQRQEDQGGEDVQEIAQRQESGEGAEADEAEENQPDESATDEDSQAKGCAQAEGESAEAEGEENETAGATEEGGESEAEEPAEEGEGGERRERDDVGCGGEGGEGGAEESAAASGGGGASCGSGAHESAEGAGESVAAGPESGAASPQGAAPPVATGSVPGCATEVEADREESRESEGGEAAPAETGGAPASASGECATAQRQEESNRDSDVPPVQEQEEERGKPGARRRGLDTDTASRLIHERGVGEPLAPTVRKRIEGSLGVDVGGIRVHADGNAQSAARALHAKAFTHRNHIFLAAGQSPHDVNLLAHESTHVLQQDAIARRKAEPGETGGRASGAGANATAGHMPAATAPVPSAVAPAPLDRAHAQPGSQQSATSAPMPGSGEPIAPPPGTSAGPAPSASAAPSSRPTPQAVAAAAAGAKAGPPVTSTVPRTASPRRAPTGSMRAPMAGESAPSGPAPIPFATGGESFTGAPSASLAALAAMSPVRAPFAYHAFSAGVQGAIDQRRHTEERDRPRAWVRPRSPHLPAGAAGAAATRGGRGAVQAEVPALDAKAPPATVPVAPATTGGAPVVETDAYDRDIDEIKEDEPTAEERVREMLDNFFAQVPTSDNHVNTDPGPAPTVTLPGRSNPAQVDDIQADASVDVAHGLEEADDERDDDFGEHDIEPDAEDEEKEIPVPASIHHMGSGCDPESGAEQLNFDPKHEAELAARVRQETGSRYDAEQARLADAESERDDTIAAERGRFPDLVAGAHDEAYGRQDSAARAARADVATLRDGWGAENRAVHTGFDGESLHTAGESRGEITTHVTGEQNAITGKFDTARTEATEKKRKLDEDAQREQERARREANSGGRVRRALRWLKNKARDAIRAVARKFKQWFNELRAWVKEKFQELKRWAQEQIDKVRDWVIGKLEDLRTKLKSMADRYLGRFPGIRDRFKAAVDTTIDAAQAGVNAAADELKKKVGAYIDGLAAAVDKTLGVAETVIVGGLEIACDLVVLGFNVTIVLVDGDLDAVIELIRELPDQPPLGGALMSMVKAGLLGFLERLRDKPADEKKRYAEKTRWLCVSPMYYAGALWGVLKGIVWDGLVGTIRIIYDVITELPKAISELFDFFRRLVTDTEAIGEIVAAVDKTREEVQAFLARPDAADQVIAFLKRSPQALLAMIDEAVRQGREWAYRAGAGQADKLFAWILNSTHFEIGESVGRFIGRIVFEALLMVFTAGAGTAIKAGGKVVQWIVKGLRMLTSGLRKGGGLIMKALSALRTVAMAGLRMAQKLGGALKRIFARVGEIVEKVFAWFRKQFGRLRPRKKGGTRRRRNPRVDAQWAAFKRAVATLALRHRISGIAKTDLKREFGTLVQRFRAAVNRPTHIRSKDGFWILWARKKGALLPRRVGRVVQDRDSRWRKGVAAVRRRMRRVRSDERTLSRLNAILLKLRRQWRFSQLEAQEDTKDLDFDIMAAMSPKRKIAEVPDNFASEKKPLPLTYPKRVSSGYPTLYFGPKVSRGVVIPQTVLKSARSSTKKKQNLARRLTKQQRKKWKAASQVIGTYQPHGAQDLPLGGKLIGIDPLWQIRRGKKLKLRPGDGTPGGGKINAPLKTYGFSPMREKMDGDHVVEIQLGGKDKLPNLWPLDSEENQLAGSTLASMTFSKPRGGTIKMSRLKQLARRGRAIWFKIMSTK